MAERIKEPETYKGKRKRRLNVIGILAFAAALLLVSLVVIFYSFQKYIVYGQDGVSLELPMLSTPRPTDSGGGQTVFEQVVPEIVVEEPDYSAVEATAGEDLRDFRALYVPSEYVAAGEIGKYIDQMGPYGADSLVLDLKPVSGQLLWNSQSSVAQSYGLSGTLELKDLVKDLKETKGYYLVAQINCCVDGLLPQRAASVTLKSALGGAYSDDSGMWLDPYNSTVRQYLCELCAELSDAGFDEILLRTLCQPNSDAGVFSYSADTSFTPTSVVGVSGMAMKIAAAMDGRSAKLSVILDAAQLRTNSCAKVGQDAELYFKIFDRVAAWAGTVWDHGVDETLIDQYVTVGSSAQRFVSYMPYSSEDLSTWIVRIPDGVIE